MGKNKTPIISNLREDCATFYTFSSAIEDIGLNINEGNNKVVLSHYVTLNLPELTLNEGIDSKLNLGNIIQDATIIDKVSTLGNKAWLSNNIQNYVLNFETVLRNQGTYDYSLSNTVTERVFWKWLQKTGVLKLEEDIASDGKVYYHENWNNTESINNTVIKGFGQITSSSQSSNIYNINQETYIMIPSSYGQMKYLMKEVYDNNYIKNYTYKKTNIENHLEGFDTEPTNNTYPYFDDPSMGTYTPRMNENEYDCVQIDFDINDISKYLDPSMGGEIKSYDDLAITKYSLSSTYDFNAILVYYTIFDSAGNGVATNLFGMMVLNSPNTSNIIPSYHKKKSADKSFGSSYSFRINIQTASIYDDTTDDIIDYSTAEASTLTDFNGVISNLNTAIEILKNNAAVTSNMYTNNQSMKMLISNNVSKINSLETSVNDLMHGNVRDINANVIDTDTLFTGNIIIDDPINILKVENDVSTNLGTISEDSFRYINAVIDNLLEVPNIKVGTITCPSTGFSINTPGGVTGIRMDINGNVYLNTLSSEFEKIWCKLPLNLDPSTAEYITDEEIESAIGGMRVGYVKNSDGNEKLSITDSSLGGKLNTALISKDGKSIDINSLSMMLLQYVKYLRQNVVVGSVAREIKSPDDTNRIYIDNNGGGYVQIGQENADVILTTKNKDNYSYRTAKSLINEYGTYTMKVGYGGSESNVVITNNSTNATDIVITRDNYTQHIPNVSATKNGLMLISDKIKLDRLSLKHVIDISYSDLLSQVNGQNLEPCMYYRIIDYNTLVNDANTDYTTANNQFDIIVRATSIYSLSETAYATQHTKEINDYFFNSNLGAWEIKYTIFNDRYAWASQNGKGVIYYMKDEFGNEAPYDFKNIKFKGDTIWKYSELEINPDAYYYTFTSDVYDDSLDTTILGKTNGVMNNIVRCDLTVTSNIKQNIFIGTNIYNNTLDYSAYNNIILSNCNNNNIGAYSSYNILYDGCYNNTLQNDTSYNTLLGYCQHNTIKNLSHYTTLGSNCTHITIGEDNGYFKCGNYCSSITVGNNNSYVNIGDENQAQDYARNIHIGDRDYMVNIKSSVPSSINNRMQNINVGNNIIGTILNRKNLIVDEIGNEHTITFEHSSSYTILI